MSAPLPASALSIPRLRTDLSAAVKQCGPQLSWKLDACDLILDAEARLVGHYVHAHFIKDMLGIGPPSNVVLSNATLTAIPLGASISQLLRAGLYGSARVLLRQFFEATLIAKHCILRPEAVPLWEGQTELSGTRTQIRMTKDIFEVYWPRSTHEHPTALHDMWKTLNKLTHPSPFTQQPPVVAPADVEPEDVGAGVGVKAFRRDMEYTADFFAAILSMNFHLLAPHFRKRVESYLRTYGRSTEIIVAERALRAELKSSISGYWASNARLYVDVNDMWRPAIKQYVSRWTPPRVGEKPSPKAEPRGMPAG